MQDDRNMDAFDVIVAELFGDAVDSRELWDVVSKQGDASEVHVPGNIKTKKQMAREKRQAQVGLASNVVGMTAGGAALMAAGKDTRLDNAGAVGRAIQKPYKLVARTKVGSKWAEVGARPKVAGGLALGAVTLQAANTAGDLVANRVLNREAKKEVKKALGDIVDARRKGKISTEDAIRLSSALVEGVSKAHSPDSDTIHEAAEAIVPLIPSKKLQMANDGYQQAKPAIDRAKRAKRMLKPKQERVAEEITKGAKGEATKILRVGLKAMGDEAKTTARAGAKAVGEEARTTVRAAGQEARTTVKSVGEETRKLPTSVDDTINEGRKLVGDVRTGVNEGRAAIKSASENVSEAAGKVGSQIKEAGDHLYRRGRKLALIGAGGVAGAATIPVGVAQAGANHRAKKYGVPIARAPKQRVKKDADIVWTGEIAKRDDEKRQVFGFALVTHVDGEPVVDRQGDFTPLEEIEKAAYTYVIESRKGGDMHARDGEMPLHTSDMVESFVITPEKLTQMGLAEDALPHGWWVGFQVNDEKQWEDVKSGKRTGFSIHGSGRRVEKSMVSKAAGLKEEAAIGASVAGGTAAASAPVFRVKLPDDGGAHKRIAESAKGGKASVADLRAVATGKGGRAFDDVRTARLAQDLADKGYDPKRPIEVTRAKDGTMRVSGGHHRLEASEHLGTKELPVVVRESKARTSRGNASLLSLRRYKKDVERARVPNAPKTRAEIDAVAARHIPKAADKVNATKSAVEDAVTAAPRTIKRLVKIGRAVS